MSVPLIPDTAPFSAEQRAWLNGFFAGLFSRNPASPSPLAPGPSPAEALAPLTILFGSQTGTAEGLAKKAAKEAGKRGFAPTVLDMAQTDVTRLAAERHLLVIVSTYGDGEPPDSAKALHGALGSQISNLKSEIAPSLAGVRFSVCALGDTNYTQFCQCGKDFDARLEKLGAVRVTPRVDCDLEYEAKFTAWLDESLRALGTAPAPALAPVEPLRTDSEPPSATPHPQSAIEYGRSRPFPALLLTSRNLSGPGSAKQVQHVEFSLEGSGLTYEAGDALGVFPQNNPEQVGTVLAALGCDGEEAVPAPDGSTTSLRRALTELYDLGKPGNALLELVAAGASPTSKSPRSTTPATVTAVAPFHVIDVLLASPGLKIPPPDFVRALRKLQPRLYSISSSPKAHPGAVHLTVGTVRYEKDGRAREGVCSTFLADRATPGSTRVGVFVHASKGFRPPADGSRPMIMVGPGTGIAPFRAFLQERRATGATGKHWLFFGDQREATDFLYRDEILHLQATGILTRLNLAWSRDRAEKVYVQHGMLEHAAELYAWLEAGAHFNVCGDASRMAKDVDAALHTVIEKAGGKTPEQAAAYIQALKSAKRYARDVY
jgi:sulfite reductase (NADPH) flavoprotein alpha-component